MQQDIMRRKKEIFDVLRKVKSFEAFDIHQIIEMAKISKVCSDGSLQTIKK